MSTLHMVNQRTALASCLQAMQTEDCLLLCGDAVLDACQALAVCQADALYLLQDDSQARGLTAQWRSHETDYSGFVQLCSQHQRVLAW